MYISSLTSKNVIQVLVVLTIINKTGESQGSGHGLTDHNTDC